MDPPADPPLIGTSTGPIAGRWVRGGDRHIPVAHFGGVPYADAGRFAHPVEHPSWSTPRDCSRPGALPPQRTEGLELVPGMAAEHTTEQCLTAEVWTPGVDGARPVVVWIPGGSFRVGGAGLATYDGRHLCADGDVVVVGLNYRLGLLGFFAHPDVPTNLGLRDLLAGLAWVRSNARALGGDPERVVLIGESAGAGAIYHLLTRPDLACSGVIVFSGSPTMTQSRATAEHVAGRVLELAGGTGAGGLADRRVEELLDLQSLAVADLARSVGMMPFHPWVDGDVVPMSPLQAAAADRLAAVPLVVGTTADEMELFRPLVPELPRAHALAMLTSKAAVLGVDGAGADRGLTACGDDLVTAIADVDLQLPALFVAESHRRRGLPVWRATFTWRSPAHGACHALDLPFHFGTLDVEGWQAFAGADDDPDGPARLLSRRMRAAWAAFAASGVPTCEPIGAWPEFTGDGRIVELGHHVGVIDDPAHQRSRCWR